MAKAISDDASKAFMQTALASNLRPTCPDYGQFEAAFVDHARQHDGFEPVTADACYHTDEGMSCFFKDATRRFIRFLSRSDW